MEFNNMNVPNTNKKSFRATIIKILIAFFLLLNVLTLSLGYSIIDSKLNNNINQVENQLLYLTKRKETILDRLDILGKSKVDSSSNLLELNAKISFLKYKINNSKIGISTQNKRKAYYVTKLETLKNENMDFQNKKMNLETQYENKQNVLKQQQIVKRKKQIKRRTRSS